jgi:hypothetical protein
MSSFLRRDVLIALMASAALVCSMAEIGYALAAHNLLLIAPAI